MSSEPVIDQLARSEIERRERRNIRDRQARAFLQDHPELVDDPEHVIADNIPDGTTEAAVRSIARHYHKMRKVRQFLKENPNGVASSES